MIWSNTSPGPSGQDDSCCISTSISIQHRSRIGTEEGGDGGWLDGMDFWGEKWRCIWVGKEIDWGWC